MRTLRTRSVALLGAVLLGSAGLMACTTPSATPSPSLDPTPEPTPDVAAVFIAQMTDPDFTAETVVTGTMVLKTGGITVEGTITGDYRFDGGDAAGSIVLEIAGITEQQDEITIGQTTYTSTNGGPYVLSDAEPGAAGEDSLIEMLSGIESLRDAGDVEHFGRTVRELRPTDPIDLDPAALGLNDPTMADAVVSMDFFAESDGTPAGFSVGVTWTQGLDTGTLADAEVTIEFEFTEVGTAAPIEAPEDIWVWWNPADAPFMVAYPQGWSTEAAFGTLIISPPDGSGFFSISLSDPAPEHETQEAFAAASLAAMAALGATPSGSTPYEVGEVSSTLMAYRDAYADVNSLVLHLPLFDGTYGYEIQFATIAAPGEESLVEDQFDLFMSTFAMGL